MLVLVVASLCLLRYDCYDWTLHDGCGIGHFGFLFDSRLAFWISVGASLAL